MKVTSNSVSTVMQDSADNTIMSFFFSHLKRGINIWLCEREHYEMRTNIILVSLQGWHYFLIPINLNNDPTVIYKISF